MQSINIIRESNIIITPRLLQMCGMFDLQHTNRIRKEWTVTSSFPDCWSIGLIVGASGSGKSTVAKEMFGDCVIENWEWDKHKSVIDSFPKNVSITEITELLSSVGFSSPPSWMCPYHVLSTGEKFRCDVARTLIEMKDLAVIDEFTSVVDRTVAKIGSAAVAKTVRKRKQKLVLVTCHEDVAEWLEPDWIYRPATNEWVGRCLQRPSIKMDVFRVHSKAWTIFKKHHYLSSDINTSAHCYIAMIENQPVAFASCIHFPHPRCKNTKREHRTVCLPDFQGVGIGNALSETIASIYTGVGARYLSITSHPAMIKYRQQSKKWKCIAAPNIKTKTMPGVGLSGLGSGKSGGISTRLRATFKYVGDAMNRDEAMQMIYE